MQSSSRSPSVGLSSMVRELPAPHPPHPPIQWMKLYSFKEQVSRP
jgi:hypothetical protein